MMEALRNLSRTDIRKPFILIAFNSAHCDFFRSLSNHLLLKLLVLIKRRRKYDILGAVLRGVDLSYSDQSLSLYFSADQVKDNSSLASLLDNVSVKLKTGGDCAHLNGELPNLDWT